MLKIGCDSIVATFLTHTGHWLDVCQDGRAIYRVWQKSIPRKTAIGIFGILAMSMQWRRQTTKLGYAFKADHRRPVLGVGIDGRFWTKP